MPNSSKRNVRHATEVVVKPFFGEVFTELRFLSVKKAKFCSLLHYVGAIVGVSKVLLVETVVYVVFYSKRSNSKFVLSDLISFGKSFQSEVSLVQDNVLL